MKDTLKDKKNKGSNLFELYSEDMEETMTDKKAPEKLPTEPKPLDLVIDDNKEFPDSAEIITNFLEESKAPGAPIKGSEQKGEPLETLQEQRKSAVSYIQRPASSSTLNNEPLRVKTPETVFKKTPETTTTVTGDVARDTEKSFLGPVLFSTFAGIAILEYFTYLFWAFSPSKESFFPYLSLSFAIFLVLSLQTGLYRKIFKDWGGSFGTFLQEEIFENFYSKKGKVEPAPASEENESPEVPDENKVVQ